jgi:hypothetical protein
MRWRDTLTGSEWEVVELTGERIYSPSGLGGTPCFWCKPIVMTPEAQNFLEDARPDGCVSFCGDSIAGGLIGYGATAPDGPNKPVPKKGTE